MEVNRSGPDVKFSTSPMAAHKQLALERYTPAWISSQIENHTEQYHFSLHNLYDTLIRSHFPLSLIVFEFINVLIIKKLSAPL